MKNPLNLKRQNSRTTAVLRKSFVLRTIIGIEGQEEQLCSLAVVCAPTPM